MARPKRKYVLFLVEGYTDIEVLAEPIALLYEKFAPTEEPIEVKFCTFSQNNHSGGDITSSKGVNPENIEGLIGKLFIDPFLEKNPFIYPKEIKEIVQIVDLDGAFVSVEKILPLNIEDIAKGIVYTETEMFAEDTKAIEERNRRKSANLCKLASLNEIIIRPKNARNTKTVKYSVYYFSSNMDHYVHKKLNLSTQEKVRLADDFSVEKAGDIEEFRKVICEDEAACRNMTYQESWEMIKEGTESLKRHTNLNILVEKLYGGTQ